MSANTFVAQAFQLNTTLDAIPYVSEMGDYMLYEVLMCSLALLINGIAFFTVGPRADDYSGFVLLLCSGMDMICMAMHLFSRIFQSEHPTGEFRLMDGSFFDTILETHFTLLFLPITLKLLLMVIHVFMQALYWFDTLRPQRFDQDTDFDEVFQSQLWINIKIKLSLILLLQACYPAFLVATPLVFGYFYNLNVYAVGRMFNWAAPLVPVLSASTLILAVPVVRAAFAFPFRCKKTVAPDPMAFIVPVQSYALPI